MCVCEFLLMLLFMFSAHICLAILNKNTEANNLYKTASRISLPAADGTVQLLERFSPLVTYIKPSSLTGLCF